MPKTKTVYICQECGARSPKWLGQCRSCGAWSSFQEEVEAPKSASSRAGFGALSASKPQRLIDIDNDTVARSGTGIGELDRVLGGGLVPGSLVLVGGDPGIGKSTLLLQASAKLATGGRKVLYVTGEESPQQTRMRFNRVGAQSDSLWLVAETRFEQIQAHVDQIKPDILVVDSIQTLHTDMVQSAPGSVTQLREVTGKLLGIAKGKGVATFLVGHVTKDGSIAGPRVLEHMVDTVLYFEGQTGNPFRVLRAVKNRFGSTNEIGTFEMRSDGLAEVTNPSALFLAERATGEAGSVVVAGFEGTRPLLVEVQALVSTTPYGNPRRTCIGADPGRVALLLAVLEKKSGLQVGGSDVFVNVAGGLRMDEPAVDLAIVAALASSHTNKPMDPNTVFFGEVGLGGEIRAVAGPDARASEAARMGFTRVIVPKSNAERVAETTQIEVVPAGKVDDLLDLIF
ncbi:MAG: DNA repair protein RadA [Bradymonadia bacterium]